MAKYVSINEAASYLGVSKATLRNWDKQGKLRAVRDPINQYRAYALSDLQQIQKRLPLNDDAAPNHKPSAPDKKTIKSLINRLNNILRDHDNQSNIIERFDELTKLLFLKLIAEEVSPSLFVQKNSESPSDYALRLRTEYEQAVIRNNGFRFEHFGQLNAADSALLECGKILSSISFDNLDFDIKGLAYEEVIKYTFDKNDNQQFFTPPPIVNFVVEMMKPFLHGNICDPASGTGGFLIQVIKNEIEYNSLIALEIDERLAWVANMNLASHGAKKFRSYWLKQHGSLGHEAEKFFDTFDAIITNPPFGSDLSDSSTLNQYHLGQNRTSRRRGILFLEQCYRLLKTGGTLGFIIDEGVLNGSTAEDVRQFILTHFEVSAIISLPETAFMPYATVSASILILKKKSHSDVKSTLPTFFAKAENIGRKPNGDDDIIYDHGNGGKLNTDLPEIQGLYKEHLGGRSLPTSSMVFSADIFENLRHDSSGSRLDFRFHHPARQLSQQRLDKAKNKLVPLADICEERNKSFIPSTEMVDETILYTGLAHIEAGNGVAYQVPTPANSLKSAVKKYEPGDVVFAKMRPGLRKAAYMNFEEGGYVSSECIVLKVKDHNGSPLIDPLLLSVLLRSDLIHGQIMHLVAGIGRPRLSAADLRRVLIPLVPNHQQKELRESYLSEINTAQKLKEKVQNLLKDADDMQFQAVANVVEGFI